MRRAARTMVVVAATAIAPAARADDLADLANKLANPIAALTSVPFQYNYDARIGPAENGTSNYMHFQPARANRPSARALVAAPPRRGARESGIVCA